MVKVSLGEYSRAGLGANTNAGAPVTCAVPVRRQGCIVFLPMPQTMCQTYLWGFGRPKVGKQSVRSVWRAGVRVEVR